MMAEPAVIGLSEGKDAAELDLPMAINSESKLLATLQKLALQNDHAVSICNNISKEVRCWEASCTAQDAVLCSSQCLTSAGQPGDNISTQSQGEHITTAS